MQRVTTTFWHDFSIADLFGSSAIADTFRRAFNEWKSDIRYLAELYVTMNHKAWQWHEKSNLAAEQKDMTKAKRADHIMALYIAQQDAIYDFVYGDDNPGKFSDEEISFFFDTTD